MSAAPVESRRGVDLDRRALLWELAIVLTLSFGIRGVRAVLNLLEAALRPERLNQQSVTLNQQQSALAWLDPLFQLTSTVVLFAWAGLAVLLLVRHVPRPGLVRGWGCAGRDWLYGAGLATIIGLPGLGLYVLAVHMGWSKEVIPSGLEASWVDVTLLVLNAWGNAFAEELIVVAWLATRLRQLRVPWVWVFVGSSVLRASYHLYQGFSAGVGNLVMGLVYLYYFKRTGRIWPLIIGHALIDTVAFVGYSLLH